MAERSSFEAARRARLDDATVFGAELVHGTRILLGRRDIERAAPISGVLHETKPGRLRLERRINLEAHDAHSFVVFLEKMDRARPMMTTAATVDAVRSVRRGRSEDRRQTHASGHWIETSP